MPARRTAWNATAASSTSSTTRSDDGRKSSDEAREMLLKHIEGDAHRA